jgi:hypothetical protein
MKMERDLANRVSIYQIDLLGENSYGTAKLSHPGLVPGFIIV